jgi:hypothetical protein
MRRIANAVNRNRFTGEVVLGGDRACGGTLFYENLF